jgi:hypothetical protein
LLFIPQGSRLRLLGGGYGHLGISGCGTSGCDFTSIVCVVTAAQATKTTVICGLPLAKRCFYVYLCRKSTDYRFVCGSSCLGESQNTDNQSSMLPPLVLWAA